MNLRLREPPSEPHCSHRLTSCLTRSARLVLQPDVMFESASRAHSVRARIWGAPDLVMKWCGGAGTPSGFLCRDRATKSCVRAS